MMKRKYQIARKMKYFYKKLGATKERRKLFRKCQRAYFIECILLDKDEFWLVFNGKYAQSFWERVKNWFRYILNPKTNCRPINLKITNAPNEAVLNRFLRYCDMEIKEEYLYPVKTVYNITVF